MRPSRISATPKRSASCDLFQQNLGAGPLLLEILRHVPDAAFDDVVAQDHADRFAVGEMLGQAQRVGDAAFALLVGVVQMLQTEFLAIRQQAQEIAGIPPARHHQDLPNTRIHQGLDGVVNHGLVVDRKQVLVGDLGEGKQSAARSARKNNALHRATPVRRDRISL